MAMCYLAGILERASNFHSEDSLQLNFRVFAAESEGPWRPLRLEPVELQLHTCVPHVSIHTAKPFQSSPHYFNQTMSWVE